MEKTKFTICKDSLVVQTSAARGRERYFFFPKDYYLNRRIEAPIFSRSTNNAFLARSMHAFLIKEENFFLVSIPTGLRLRTTYQWWSPIVTVLAFC